MDRAAPDDRELVEATRRGDRAGLEGMYRRYADRLYTYARSVLGEPEAAADAVHDGFLLASRRIDQLRDPDRLRPWLYAIVRNECLRLLRERSRSAPLDEAGEVPAEPVDPGAGLNAAQVRDLVHAATAALNPGDREVVQLAIRHELSPTDIGAALGMPANHAHARLSRARTQLERSLGALLVARSGADSCVQLAELIEGWHGRLTPILRKRVVRHIEGCAVCGLLRREQLNPAALLSAYTAPPFLVVADAVWPRLAEAGLPVTDATPSAATAQPAPQPDDRTLSTPDTATEDLAATTPAEAGDGPPGQPSTPGAQPDASGSTTPAADPPPAGAAGTTQAAPAPAAAHVDGVPIGAIAGQTAPSTTAPVAATAHAAARPVRAGSRPDGERRRRRRPVVIAGILVVLAALGTWAALPTGPAAGPAGRPAAQVLAPSAGPPAAPTGSAPAAPPGSGATSTAPPSPASAGLAGSPAAIPASEPAGPDTGGQDGTAPKAGPAVPPPAAPAPTIRPPTAPRPTIAPTVAAPFTISATARVRCGRASSYSLVVRATGSSSLVDAEVRWSIPGAGASSQAMTVDGSTARTTLGSLTAATLTWSVRATATDGRTAQSPSYPVTDPCPQPVG
ncbi:sigma-70 family RNA polymerase sigma factor [Micromonospora sp. BQ11]|uniref:sigma-70 family RNA polymerase sigma factor n=1 Tax=Micromonospora sp. BQ11 TaxID=3452212 RepID=UPI003F88FA49